MILRRQIDLDKLAKPIPIRSYQISVNVHQILTTNHSIKKFQHKDTNLKLKMKEKLRSEVTSEISLADIVESTPDVFHPNEIKREFSPSESQSHSDFLEHAVVKHEDTSNEMGYLQIKSEVSDLKYAIIEPLESEELHIKNEVEEILVDQTIKKSAFVHLNNHSKAKPFQCNICDYKSKRIENLQHMKIHTGEKPFHCNICGYKSIRMDNLQRHMKIHTGEKPFECTLCNYKCIEKKRLQQHMKTHTGEKPFQCNICGYKSIRTDNLQRHMKIHTGEKPLQCNICDYKCIEKKSLQQHMKTHTGEKLSMQCI